MLRIALIAVTALAGWLGVPWLAMWRHGTRDQQTVRAWRTEPEEKP